MKKYYLIAFTLVGLISCQPRILGINALTPISYAAATVNDFEFTKAFFNQYSGLVSYDLKLDYPPGLTSPEQATFRNNAINYQASSGSTPIDFTDWDTTNPDFAIATLDSTWKGYFNQVLFSRNFVSNTGKAQQFPQIRIDKTNVPFTSFDNILSINITSSIRYRIAPAQMLLAWSFTLGDADDQFFYNIAFFSNEVLLNVIDFPQITTTTSLDTYKAVFPVAMTNVNQIQLNFGLADANGGSNPRFTLHEFNLFAESYIAVPDNADSEEIFGIEYIQVEWWDILGHLNNGLWWLVNESFLSPVFEWLNDYILTFFNFIFNSIGALLGL